MLTVGVWARVEGDVLIMDGVVLSADGERVVRSDTSGTLKDADAMGRLLAQSLLDQGADALIGPP